MQMDMNLKGESLPSEASLRIERKIKLSDGKYSLTLVRENYKNFCKLLTGHIRRKAYLGTS